MSRPRSASGDDPERSRSTGASRGGLRTAAPLLALDEVRFTYPDGHRALDGVTLRIEPGERLAVLGPNGAGKSTLCLNLNGILTPSAGRVEVAGLDTADRRALREIRRRVGLVFQDPDDQLFLPTVRDDVAFGPANLGLSAEAIAERVTAALAAVRMGAVEDRPPHHLSFGERKRVAIATVLAMDPDVLVLDEPSSNLDPRSRRELGEILTRLPQTLVLVTHDLPFAAEHCDRAVVLDAGRIAADGPIRDVLADEALLAAHALELPVGFDLSAIPAPALKSGGRPLD